MHSGKANFGRMAYGLRCTSDN